MARGESALLIGLIQLTCVQQFIRAKSFALLIAFPDAVKNVARFGL
jgi:hypothetical protein